MKNELISLHEVSKSFGRKIVLDHIDLAIQEGESVALLGVNGSRKSTLLRMLCGLTGCSSGKITYARGLKFNYIPEHFPKINMTVRQYLRHMGRMEKLSEQTIEDKSRELAQSFYMEDMLDVSMRNLSKGTLQKTAVLQALLSKPDVLLMDEPLSGQDLKSQNRFIDIMNELRKQGVTIIMSCHEMFLVKRISDLAYEIKNKRLEPCTITRDRECDLLVFEQSANGKKLINQYKGMAEKIDADEREIRIVIRREKSNELIHKMLKDGFMLRSMKGMEV